MRILKASVIIMAVLIVGGIVVLAVLLVNRAGGPAESPGAAGQASRPAGAGNEILRLGLPSGTRVRQVASSPGQVVLHLTVPGQGEWVYVVPTSGGGSILRIAVSAQ